MIRTIVLGALLVSTLSALACDQCGCGSLLGIQPFDRSHNFGLNYRLRYLQGDLIHGTPLPQAKHGDATGGGIDTTRYTEIYAALELRGQYWLGQRLSLFAVIPLVNNYAAADHVTQADIYAMGDPQLMARYVVLNTRYSLDTTGTRHRITVGIGMKLPLAQQHMAPYGTELAPDLQPSTGTWDGLMSIEYLMRRERWGFSLGTIGRYNGTSATGFQSGPSATAQLEVFHTWRLGAVQWLPGLGGYVEHSAPDREQGIIDRTTGGSVLFSNVGTRIWWRNIGINVTWQHAVAQDLGTTMIPNRERFIAGITYNINKDL
jgi:Putative MetA-pathway of phenol degradation